MERAGLPTSLGPVWWAVGGLSLPLLIPLFQFGLVFKLWDQYAMPVHRDHCSNSCWDTVFKGGYETGAGTYKHVYFNATLQTWKAAAWPIKKDNSLQCVEHSLQP